ncbi:MULTISPECIES: hypothetical protein [Magnetospirillum]|nr:MULTISPECIES: hypothetical protein [Magnetospirillum]CAA7618453.1 conserved hypothetical protein [Magnetospirillum sp. LM-5]
MTFDFAPDWMGAEAGDFTGTAQVPVAVPPLSPPPPCAPAHPTDRELATLVGELFTEGTLSWDQLRTLGNVGELRNLLTDTIAEVPLARRITERRS